jgi:hypothetical protein
VHEGSTIRSRSCEFTGCPIAGIFTLEVLMNIVAPRAFAPVLAALAHAACGTNVVVDAPPAASGTATHTSPVAATTSSTTSSTSSSTSSGTTTTVAPPDPGAGGAGGATQCVPKPDDGGAWHEPTCADLDVLAVEGPTLTDADGDGLVEVGESAVLEVGLRETAAVGFLAYPGVAFTTETPGVTVTSDDWRYAILACQTDRIAASIAVGKDVPPGTKVTVTARAAMLGGPCPDAPSIDVVFEVH